MSLLTEQEIKDILIPLFIKQDQASIHWPDIFEEVALIEAAVIDKIKAQGVAVWSCDVLQTDATFKQEFSAIEPPLDYYSVRNIAGYYRLPEGD